MGLRAARRTVHHRQQARRQRRARHRRCRPRQSGRLYATARRHVFDHGRTADRQTGRLQCEIVHPDLPDVQERPDGRGAAELAAEDGDLVDAAKRKPGAVRAFQNRSPFARVCPSSVIVIGRVHVRSGGASAAKIIWRVVKKSKGQRRREKIARRIALQEEDERLGRRSPPMPTSLPPEERERRR